ncbi:MAG: DUF3798 domain-containing protein, partial [Leptolinea sp.]|nr:DUF3798 domain-containing protein [Leptolinea sp.]
MKIKKSLFHLFLLIVSFALVFSSTACRSTEAPPAEQPPQEQAPAAEQPEVKSYKIGILTGTVSQGEEEYQEAMNQIAKYGNII